ncbi:hypothetical protein QQP08_027571 [Theobroma cacao]|nr:hypothetical protein QQP08_027571 [Theobroma cacao]
MWVNHFTKLSFLQLIPTPFPALLSELFTSSAVPRFRSIALEFKISFLVSGAWVTALCKKLAMWWPWVRQIFAIGYATFIDKLLTSKIVAEVAIRKSINTNAISVVEKFQKVRLKFPFSILW